MPLARSRDERGAIAVEFALVVPVLILIVLLMVDFGRLMFVQISLNAGAKEAVRSLALGKIPGETEAAFLLRVSSLARTSSDGSASMAQIRTPNVPIWVCGTTSFTRTSDITSTSCTTPVPCTSAGGNTSLTLATRFRWLTPVRLANIGFTEFNLSSKAVSLCMSS